MKNKYKLTIINEHTRESKQYEGTIDEICYASRTSRNIIMSAIKSCECSVCTDDAHVLVLRIKRIPNREFDYLDLSEFAYELDCYFAFDTEKYSKKEALEKVMNIDPDGSYGLESIRLGYARSEVRLGEDGPAHGYVIYENYVKRSFAVWLVNTNA